MFIVQFYFTKTIATMQKATAKTGSIIFVVGKSPMDIMEPILL